MAKQAVGAFALNTSKSTAASVQSFHGFPVGGSTTLAGRVPEIGAGDLAFDYGGGTASNVGKPPPDLNALDVTLTGPLSVQVGLILGAANSYTLIRRWTLDVSGLAGGDVVFRTASFGAFIIEIDCLLSAGGTSLEVIFHRFTGSEVTIAGLPIPTTEATWVLRCDYAAGTCSVDIDGTNYPGVFSHAEAGYSTGTHAVLNENVSAELIYILHANDSWTDAELADHLLDEYDLTGVTASTTIDAAGVSTSAASSASAVAAEVVVAAGVSTSAASAATATAAEVVAAAGVSTSAASVATATAAEAIAALASSTSAASSSAAVAVELVAGVAVSTSAASSASAVAAEVIAASGVSTSAASAATATATVLSGDAIVATGVSTSAASTASAVASEVIAAFASSAAAASVAAALAFEIVAGVAVSTSAASAASAVAAEAIAAAGVSTSAASAATATAILVDDLGIAAAGVSTSAASSASAVAAEVIAAIGVSTSAASAATATFSGDNLAVIVDTSRPYRHGADLMTNRAHILREIEWRLGRITAANGYPVTVRRVERELLSVGEVQRSDMPLVCFVPAIGQPPTVYGVAGMRDEFLRVSIIAHVAGDSYDDRASQLAMLERSIIEELDIDNTRGGWATHTVRVAGGDSDEGTPVRGGHNDHTATLVTTVQAMFTPGTWSAKVMRYGSIYTSAPAAQTLVANTYAEPAGTWTAGVSSSNVTGSADGGLTYTQERPLVFRATAVLSVACASAGVLSARLAVNGEGIARTVQSVSTGAETVQIHLDDLLELTQSDEVTIQIAHTVGQSVTTTGVLTLAPAPLV